MPRSKAAAASPKASTKKKSGGTPKVKGASTPKANGASTPKANGASTPKVNGASTPKANGASTPKVNGASTPKVNGASTPKAAKRSPATPLGDGRADMVERPARSTDEETEEPPTSVEGEIQCARDRWFRVEGHLHLGLGLTLGKIYPASDLNRKCKGDQKKLKRLLEMMESEELLTEVAKPPERPKASGKRLKKELSPSSARRANEDADQEKQRLRRRALSRRICLGQLVWDCSQKEPRAARVTAIAAERSQPFLIRHLDAPKGPSNTSFKVGEEVLVDDKRGVCIWDGRPEHDYAKVRWSDGSESGILPICRIRTEEAHFYEETFVADHDLEPLSLSRLLSSRGKEIPDLVVEAPRCENDYTMQPPMEVRIRSSDLRRQLEVGEVAWCSQAGRPPWPVRLLSFTEGLDGPAGRLWKVNYLECDMEEQVLASRLSAFRPGDALALAEVARLAEQEFRNTSESRAAKAAAAAEVKVNQEQRDSSASLGGAVSV